MGWINKTAWKELYFIYGGKHIVLKTYILFEFETQRVHLIFLVHKKWFCPFSEEYRIYTAAHHNNTTAPFLCLALHRKHNLHNTSKLFREERQTWTLSIEIHHILIGVHFQKPRTLVTLSVFVCLYLSVVCFMLLQMGSNWEFVFISTWKYNTSV